MPLRRNLGFLGTVALPVGGMAPTLAMSVTGVQVVHLLGRAAPLAYLLAGLVYAFIGKTLGPGAGFAAT